MTTVVHTYKDIVGFFEQACTAHQGIKSFAEGAIDYLDANSQNIKYPFVFLRPLVSTGITANVRSLTWELYSLDVPLLSDQSPLDVKSRTELLQYDVLSYMNYGPVNDTNWMTATMTSMTPVNEAFNDRVYGWVSQVTVAESGLFNYCFYPQL
tara:strand:- start:1325 stop:1783 length:459 start_codon:yes stop_codon:yes gene_type:complete